MDFRGRDVVVTGAAGALGGVVAEALLAGGARCHLPWPEGAAPPRFAAGAPGRVRLVPVGTLAEEASVAALYDGIDSLWASIHIAGGFAMGRVADTGKAALMAQLDTNLVSCFLCCGAAVRAMTGKGGRIVNVAARTALEPRLGAGMAAYAASKAAVAALTAALAQEVVGDGILVNAVAPSILDTKANREAMPNADHRSWPALEEVAAVILFLASPENRVTRGAVLPVYGRS